MIKVNKDIIIALNPCNDRLENYITHYNDKTFTKQQFMGLKSITQQDKLWVAFRLMSKDNRRLAAADIAELVLHIFESAYPNDLRPRKAIEAARNGDAAYTNATNAAYASYATATLDAATNAAAAAYAATNAADSNAAYYGTAYGAYAANAAARAAAYAANAADDSLTQKKLIRKIVMKYWK